MVISSGSKISMKTEDLCRRRDSLSFANVPYLWAAGINLGTEFFLFKCHCVSKRYCFCHTLLISSVSQIRLSCELHDTDTSLKVAYEPIPAGIYVCVVDTAKAHYGTSLSNVDSFHGGAESFLTLTNLFIVLGLRKALRNACETEKKASNSFPVIKEEKKSSI